MTSGSSSVASEQWISQWFQASFYLYPFCRQLCPEDGTVAIYVCVWVCVGLCGFVWVLCGFVWVCVGLCGVFVFCVFVCLRLYLCFCACVFACLWVCVCVCCLVFFCAEAAWLCLTAACAGQRSRKTGARPAGPTMPSPW